MSVIVTIGEALVEIMRTSRDRPLDRPGIFSGPYPSGAPAIFASAAARLGAQVGFVGTVGDDPFGDCLTDRLLADGIDCSCLRRTAKRMTGIAFVSYHSDGSRSFVFHLAQSAAAMVSTAQLTEGYLDNTRYLHIMGSSLSISEELRGACYHAAQVVHDRGGTVSLDPNLRPELMPVERIRTVCEPVLKVANIVLPSGEEATALTGTTTPEKAADCLLGEGIRLVALKQGKLGCTLYAPERTTHIPAYAIEEVDPTGAGDCFDAALIVGISEGWPIEKAGLFANAVGALATTRLGPMEGTFGRDVVCEFMASQGRPLQ